MASRVRTVSAAWLPLLVGVATVAAPATTNADEPAGDAIDAVVAWVGDPSGEPGPVPILASDVMIAAALGTTGGCENDACRSAERRSAYERVANEVLLAREADRLGVQPSSGDRATARAITISEAGDEATLRTLLSRLELEEREVDLIIERRARAAALIRVRRGPSREPSEEELRAAHARGSLRARPYLDVRDVLRVQLIRVALNDAVAEIVAALRGRTPIRLLDRSLDARRDDDGRG